MKTAVKFVLWLLLWRIPSQLGVMAFAVCFALPVTLLYIAGMGIAEQYRVFTKQKGRWNEPD